jgi:polyisoprenoid-binding protein YceI
MTTLPITDNAPQRLAGTRWRLDPSASSAEFRVPHFWRLVTVKGHFERLDGRLEIDESGQLKMSLTIDAASLHTGIRQRDKHLRAAAFFDTQHHPEVRFRSTSVSNPRENPFRVEGELEVAGERVQLQLEATIQQTDDQLGIEATTTVDQRKLGMTWSPLGMTRTPTTLAVHAHLRQES